MPLDITFTLSDQDLEHFQAIVDKAKTAMESSQSAEQIEAAARQLISDAKSTDLPDFIADRLSQLEVVISMVGDQEWQLSEEERLRVLGALVYFCDPEDLIPDHIPGLGFLDRDPRTQSRDRILRGVLRLPFRGGEAAQGTGARPARGARGMAGG